MMVTDNNRLPLSLLFLRIGVFIVMFVWALDKIVQPDHAAAVFANFYLLEGMEAGVLAAIGVIQIVIYLAFLGGLFRTWTYGLVLAMHTVSTLSSYQQYLDPFNNLLFFAAWPMLAACIALFLLRDADTLWSVDAMRARA
jgi:putative oxidoreductase